MYAYTLGNPSALRAQCPGHVRCAILPGQAGRANRPGPTDGANADGEGPSWRKGSACRRPLGRSDRPKLQNIINHYPGFVEAWAIVKLAAARANTDVGAMKKETLAAIEKAAEAVLNGKYHDQFVVDWYQGGAGTSTNMNANEVLANIALELTGHKKGEYQIIEPHDDLNMSQSTNDSYPTAIKVAFILRNDKLIEELEKLAASFRAKGDAFIDIVKMGRTELQDAVPMTVGQEFHAFAASRDRDRAACVTPRSICTRSTWAPPPSAPGSTRRRATPSEPRRIWQSSPESRSCPPPTCWRRPGTSRASSSIPRR